MEPSLTVCTAGYYIPAVLAFVFLLLIAVAVVLVRALSRHKGEYLTQVRSV